MAVVLTVAAGRMGQHSYRERKRKPKDTGWLMKQILVYVLGAYETSLTNMKGPRMVARSIRWESDWDLTLAAARVQEKRVLLDFSNPG